MDDRKLNTIDDHIQYVCAIAIHPLSTYCVWGRAIYGRNVDGIFSTAIERADVIETSGSKMPL